MEEWKEVRGVLEAFDDRIHDLRKYGFTLITGLLAIQGFLLPSIPTGAPSEVITTTDKFDANGILTERTIENVTTTDPYRGPSVQGLPYEVKIAILAVTAVLVVALRWLDSNYRGLQRGAALRGKVIERFLNLEVTDEIATRYEAEKLGKQILVLFYAFEAATVLLAFFLLPNFVAEEVEWDWNGLNEKLILILTLSLVGEVIYSHRFVNPDKLRGPLPTEWALDRIQCKQGDPIRIMMTNIQENDRILNVPTPQNPIRIWDVLNDRGESVITGPHPGEMSRSARVETNQSYVWMFTAHFAPGLYRIRVDMDPEGMKILERERVKKKNRPREADALMGRELDRRLQVLASTPKEVPANLPGLQIFWQE